MSTYLKESTAPPHMGNRSSAVDQSLGGLVNGILADMQRLLAQHLDLFHQEIRADFRRTKDGVLSIGLGGVFAVLAAFLAIPALVGFLAWAVPAVPWWGWCGILAGVLAVVAGVLIGLGRKELNSFNPMPDQSAQAVKENFRWISDRVTSDQP